jgi:hypothetical protein
MKLTKSILRGMIREVINEKEDQEGGRIDMDDPVMQKTGWYSDNPELTIGGVLKQGEKHPAYKDALKAVGKEKDKGGEDKPEPKQTKISSDPFAKDDKKEKPSGEPKGDDFINPQSKDVLAKMKPSDVKKKSKPSFANLDYDKAEDDLDDLRYSGTVEDNPSLTYNIGDMIKSIQGGHSSPEDIARAEEISDTLDHISQTNDEDPESFEKLSMALDTAIKGTQKESITSKIRKEFKQYNKINKNLLRG